MKRLILSIPFALLTLSLTAMEYLGPDKPEEQKSVVGSSTVGVGEIISSTADKEESKTQYKATVVNLLDEVRAINCDHVNNYLLQLSEADKNDTYNFWNDHRLSVLVAAKIARTRTEASLTKFVKTNPFFENFESGNKQGKALIAMAENALLNKMVIMQYDASHHTKTILLSPHH